MFNQITYLHFLFHFYMFVPLWEFVIETMVHCCLKENTAILHFSPARELQIKTRLELFLFYVYKTNKNWRGLPLSMAHNNVMVRALLSLWVNFLSTKFQYFAVMYSVHRKIFRLTNYSRINSRCSGLPVCNLNIAWHFSYYCWSYISFLAI